MNMDHGFATYKAGQIIVIPESDPPKWGVLIQKRYSESRAGRKYSRTMGPEKEDWFVRPMSGQTIEVHTLRDGHVILMGSKEAEEQYNVHQSGR